VGKVVIAGGGIIGSSVAHYLTLKGACDVTVVERAGVANAASGTSSLSKLLVALSLGGVGPAVGEHNNTDSW